MSVWGSSPHLVLLISALVQAPFKLPDSIV